MNAVENYLKAVPEPQKAELLRVRDIIAATAPTATEVITYGMPGFKYKGKYLMAYAPFKNHLSIFPGSHAIELEKDALSTYKTSKGTVQYTLAKPIPKSLIVKIVTHRINDIDAAA